jgi:Holliday junction resolvase RusA-like endonuclease
VSAVLEIIIPGRPVSGNHAKVPTENGRQVRSKESREYDARIASIAKAAVVSAGWVMPDYVNVDVILANLRGDRDNYEKEIMDGLQGIVFSHDSRILDGRTKKIKDDGGPRVILHISEVNGANYGYEKPRLSKPGTGYYLEAEPLQRRSVPVPAIAPRRAKVSLPELPITSQSAAEAKRRTNRKHAIDTALIPAVSFAKRDEVLKKARRQ